MTSYVLRCLLLRAAELQNTFELVRRRGHHREAPHAHQPQVGERAVLLNLGERHRPRQSPHRPEIHDGELGVLLLRVWVRFRDRLGYADHRLLVTGVIHQHAVTRLDLTQVLQGEVVLDPVPDGGLLPGEVVIAVCGWLGLHDPVAGYKAGCGGWWRLVEVWGGLQPPRPICDCSYELAPHRPVPP